MNTIFLKNTISVRSRTKRSQTAEIGYLVYTPTSSAASFLFLIPAANGTPAADQSSFLRLIGRWNIYERIVIFS
jgi:hypothetical protein